MELSRKAKRMQAHHKRNKNRGAALNMVALMDIFTILVFFLLVSTSSEEALPVAKDLTLPVSNSKVVPKKTVILAITNSQILLQGRLVMNRADIKDKKALMIKPLYKRLIAFKNSKESHDLGAKNITIMGDKKIQYSLVKSVMATASQAGFERISFAVSRSEGQ